MNILKFLPMTSLTNKRQCLCPMTEHFLNHKKCRMQIQTSIFKSLKHTTTTQPRDIRTWLLNIATINPTFRKYWFDCTQGSSNIPERRTSSVLNIGNMSIFPMTLKLGLCISFSTWTGFKLKGYYTPAFCVGFLSRALIKSLSAPPQHTIVGPIDTTLSN